MRIVRHIVLYFDIETTLAPSCPGLLSFRSVYPVLLSHCVPIFDSFVRLSTDSRIYLYLYISISVYLSIYLSIHLYIYPLADPSVSSAPLPRPDIMGDNRRAKRRKTNLEDSNSESSSSRDVATSMSSKRDSAVERGSSSRRLRKRRGPDPSDSDSSSQGDDQQPADPAQSSDPEPSTSSRSTKRKREHSTATKARPQVRNVESLKFFYRLTADLYDHEDAEEFQMPVLKKYKSTDVPGYKEAVPNPMDLGTVKKNITSDAYVKKSEDGNYYFDEAKCLADLRLVFNNCKAYNVEDSLLYEHADKFLKSIDTRLQRRATSAQRIAKAQHAKKLKARRETERRKLNASDPKVSSTNARASKASVEPRISNQLAEVDQLPHRIVPGAQTESKSRKEEVETGKVRDGEMPQTEKGGGPQSESASHGVSSNKPVPNTPASLSQNFSRPASVPATAAPPGTVQLHTTHGIPQTVMHDVFQGTSQVVAPHVVPNTMPPDQSHNNPGSAPSTVPQAPNHNANLQGVVMMQPNMATLYPNGSLLTADNSGAIPGLPRTFGGTPASVPRMMQQISPINLTGLSQNVPPQEVVPSVFAAPSTMSIPGGYPPSAYGAGMPVAPSVTSTVPDPRFVPDAGANPIAVSAFEPADGTQDEGDANGRDSDMNGDEGDELSEDGSDEEEGAEDLDLQGGDISFTFVSTDGLEKKRGRKSVRVMELEAQHDNLMKRRRVMVELALELEKRRHVEMPFLEKKKLCEEAAALDYVRMKGVVDILARGMSRPDYVNEVEIDLDIDAVDNSVLREIQYFLKNPAAMTAKESVRQVESQITEIEAELVELRYQKALSERD